MFLVYANVSSLDLFTRLYTYAHISQVKTAGIVFHFLEFNNDYTLQSMLVFLPCCYNTI